MTYEYEYLDTYYSVESMTNMSLSVINTITITTSNRVRDIAPFQKQAA